MNEHKFPKPSSFQQLRTNQSIFEKLPLEAKKWAESLPWNERRYVLSLCHLLCAATPGMQADFLDDYTANGLVSRKLEHRDTQGRVEEHLKKFQIETELTDTVLRSYIRQFYIHSAQDVRRQPDRYLESALRLVLNTEERTNVFNYILGFEVIKMMFKMSWLQHERLYQLQKNQYYFFNSYIKPVQHTHKINGIVIPANKVNFFEKRDYFVQKPEIKERKLIELVMATFTTDVVTSLGFSIIRNLDYLVFDYEYIYNPEPENVFIQ